MLNSKVYDFLKYLTIIVLPAIGALYTGLAQIWDLPYSAQIPATITVICTFLGAILCISTAQYNKYQPAVPEEDDGEYIYPDEEDDE
jgi:hypothetical protein